MYILKTAGGVVVSVIADGKPCRWWRVDEAIVIGEKGEQPRTLANTMAGVLPGSEYRTAIPPPGVSWDRAYIDDTFLRINRDAWEYEYVHGIRYFDARQALYDFWAGVRTQQALADFWGVSLSTMRRLLSGKSCWRVL